jgi:asparagine synthase (glutamine-hydrolysing)
MCGIAGYAGLHRPELLLPMRDAMRHRGPDDAGVWHDAEAGVGLAHRRLSILDLSSAGHQPMVSESGKVWIVYNGETYDFQQHRDRLERLGHRFRGHSDTEVLLALYEERGPEFLQCVNGMFALALWDAGERRLLLARDHAGVKPLYYVLDGPRIYFASEIKALLRLPDVPRRLHLPSLRDYLTYTWVPGERTLLDSVSKLEPGHYLIWKDGETSVRRWFDISYRPDPSGTEASWVEAVHDTFMRTTERQMVSDVPLGAFLSGGLDSSSIVACMRRSFPDRPITCYTVRFAAGAMASEQGVEDYPYATRVAAALGIDLKDVFLEPDVVKQLPKMVYHLDEPDADPAVFPNHAICRLAREDGIKVLLSGTGGDELFFGYRSHQAYRDYERLPRWVARHPAALAVSALAGTSASVLGAQHRLSRRLAKFGRGLGKTGLERHLALSEWSSAGAREALLTGDARGCAPTDGTAAFAKYAREFVGEGELNLHSHLLIQTFLAAHNFLYTDKSSMAESVEVRVPFMDVELMRLCARIPESFKVSGRTTKHVLKKAIGPYLPADVVNRAKTGFGAPLYRWVRDDLADLIQDQLGPARIAERGLFEPREVQRLLEENRSRRVDHTHLIYALLTLEIWMQTFLDRPGVEVAF